MIFDNFDNMTRYTKDSLCRIIKRNEKDEVIQDYVGYISRAEGSPYPAIFKSKDGDVETIQKNLHLYEFVAPICGYIQTANRAEYVQRNPRRIWKVGLSTGNCNSSALRVYNKHQLADLFQQVQNKQYANPRTLFNNMKSKDCIAISRRYALTNNSLEYCGRLAGIIDYKQGLITFKTDADKEFHQLNIGSYGFEDFIFISEPQNKIDMRNYNYDHDV